MPRKGDFGYGMDCGGGGGGSTLEPRLLIQPQASGAGLSGSKAAAMLAVPSAHATACTGGLGRAAGAVTPWLEEDGRPEAAAPSQS